MTVEKDVCDIFKVQDVEKSTGLGVDGKIRHKSLELIKEAMDDVSVVGLLQEKDGSKKLYTALEREISKTSCFEAPKEPFLDTHSAKEGIHVFFSDTGMNLRFTVQVHTGQNKEINEAFDRISVEKANVKSQKLKAEGEAESLKIKKAAEAKVFKDAYIDYTTEDGEFGLTKSQAVYQANLLADYFDSETLVSLAGPDGKKLKGSIERLVALAKKITTE